jgi:hypothetical protein
MELCTRGPSFFWAPWRQNARRENYRKKNGKIGDVRGINASLGEEKLTAEENN